MMPSLVVIGAIKQAAGGRKRDAWFPGRRHLGVSRQGLPIDGQVALDIRGEEDAHAVPAPNRRRSICVLILQEGQSAARSESKVVNPEVRALLLGPDDETLLPENTEERAEARGSVAPGPGSDVQTTPLTITSPLGGVCPLGRVAVRLGSNRREEEAA